MARKTWEYITETATSDEGLGAKAAFYFHCYNPNGARAAWNNVAERVAEWCTAHPERPNGVLMVHSTLNSHPWNMEEAARKAIKQRRNVSFACLYAIKTWERETREAEEFLVDESKWPAPKA